MASLKQQDGGKRTRISRRRGAGSNNGRGRIDGDAIPCKGLEAVVEFSASIAVDDGIDTAIVGDAEVIRVGDSDRTEKEPCAAAALSCSSRKYRGSSEPSN